MQSIDYGKWERRELYDYVKSRNLGFYYALTYLVTKAVNSVRALRVTMHGGEPVLLDERIPSFTDLKKGAETFHIVTMRCDGDIDDFCRAAKIKSAAQTSFIDMSSEGDDLIFISCLPWVELTAMTNERDYVKDDAIPRITWGKYRDDNGRKILGMSLELNHAFADGKHVGDFAAELRRLIEELKEMTV